MKRITAVLVALVIAISSLLTGCGDDGTGRGFRFPLDREPRQLDPQVSTDTASVTLVSVLFEGLTRLDTNGKPIPGAAEWTVSEDGLTYTFTLKESYWSTVSVKEKDLLWEDPVMVTADDFVFGMQRALSPDTGSVLGKELYAIQNAQAVHEGKKPLSQLGVRAQSNTVLTVTLSQPDEHFLVTLATTPCMPCNREFFAYTAGRYGLEKPYILTNGPFSLTAWNHNESLLLNKNEHYHGAADVTPTAVRFVIGSDKAADGLLDGTMDAALLPVGQLDDMIAAGVQPAMLEDSIRSVWFNTAIEPLSSVHIRRALRSSIEWETIYDYMEQVGEPVATGYVAPAATLPDGTIYRNEGNANAYRTDLATAREALGKGLAALYPEQTASVLPPLVVLSSQDEVSANLARYLVQSWQKNLHISVKLQLVNDEQLVAAVVGGNYQIALYTTTATGLTGAENVASYTTRGVNNYSVLSDKAVDAAWEKALRGGREELTALETLLYQSCPTLPVSFPRRYYGVAAGTQGIVVRPFGGGKYGCPFEFLKAKKWDK